MNDVRPKNDGPRVYEQAQQFIVELISGPEYRGGDRIPSERELGERTGISRMTIRKAIGKLVALGVLERRGTSGTFITEPVIRRPVSSSMFVRGLSEIIRQCGGEPGGKLLVFEERAADERVASRLQIQRGAPLFVMRRLRFVNDLPFCIETTHLNAARVPGLVADDVVGQRSLYDLLAERYRIRMRGGQGTVGMTAASRVEANLLGLQRDPSVLLFKAVSFDVEGKPLEYLNSINHPQRVVFEIPNHSA